MYTLLTHHKIDHSNNDSSMHSNLIAIQNVDKAVYSSISVVYQYPLNLSEYIIKVRTTPTEKDK